ncbi:MAG: PaaI family thioesterase [Prevotella sp.]|nr:PaaI family thioesterase [Prevotella sp.]
MDLSYIIDHLGDEPTLARTLGMTFLSTPEPDRCVATMAVDGRTRQPFGVLSGGATLALAETLAGVGSLALCPGEKYVGVNVSGSHVKAVQEGDTITAVARIVHRGRRFHVWNVEVTNTAGEVISTITVTNYAVLIKPREVGE